MRRALGYLRKRKTEQKTTKEKLSQKLAALPAIYNSQLGQWREREAVQVSER